MSGVKVALDEAGCLLADGHSSEGVEMAVGLQHLMPVLLISSPPLFLLNHKLSCSMNC